MQKQKFMTALSFLGFIFIVALAIGFFYTKQGRIELLKHQIDVPEDLQRQFGRVITKTIAEKPISTKFLTPQGDNVTWDNFKGKYLLVNFWATWCGPCVVELPSLDKLQSRFKNSDLGVIAVSLDQQRNHEYIKKFTYNRNIGEFAAYFDKYNEIKRNIRMRGIPTTYLLNPNGKILYIFEGDAEWDSPSSIEFFNTLLQKQDH